MFYFKEIYYRVLFIIFSFFFTLFIIYTFKNILIILIILPFVIFGSTTKFVNYFIYTHPIELLAVLFKSIIFFSFFFFLPYFIWSILDFLKTSLYFFETKVLKNILFIIILIFSFLNIICFFFFFPNLWKFFESFNNINDYPINMFLELKIADYFKFICSYLLTLNISLLVLFLTIILTLKINYIYILKYKKFYIFLNIILATILSTPEFLSQVFIFFILCLILELIIISLLVLNKVNKVIN